jgi:hypothetical protein
MRDRKQRKYGQDQPWREERRLRYPDEPYGGERDARWSADDRQSYRGPGWEPNQDWRGQSSRGADYRRDFRGPEGYGEHDFDRDRMMDWNNSRWNRGASFGFGPEEDIERAGNYAYGSPYGQGDMGTDRMGRGDWIEPPNWTASRDWSSRGGSSENYAGRGPKDYRRSDDRIKEEVCDMFTDDWRLDASDLAVKVEGCEVTLTGTVATRDQKRRAEEIAERVRGVSDVHNQIRVMRSEITTGVSNAPQASPRGGRASSSPQQGVAHDRDRDR